MVTSLDINGYLFCEFTFAEKLDASNTFTLTCVSREIDDGLFVDSDNYLPILKSISGMGAEMGLYMPLRKNGTIVLDISPNSFGYEKRFLDLLERFTINNQEVTVYYELRETDEESPSATPTPFFTSAVRGWSADFTSNTISINITPRFIEQRIVHSRINYTSVNVTQSVGKYLPLIIGNDVEYKPIPTVESAGETTWAVATLINNGGFFTEMPLASNFFARTAEGEYQEVSNPALITTQIMAWDDGSHATAIWASFFHQMRFAVKLNMADGLYPLAALAVRLDGNNSTANDVEGFFKCKIVPDSGAGVPSDQVLAEGSFDKANYQTEYEGTSEFWVTMHLNRVFIPHEDIVYWVIFEAQQAAASDSNVTNMVQNNSTEASDIALQQGLDSSSQGLGWLDHATPGTVPRMYFLGVSWDNPDTASNLADLENGLAIQTMDSNIQTGHEGTEPIMRHTDWVLRGNGPTQEGSTNRPDDIIEWLTEKFRNSEDPDFSSLGVDQVDFTKWSTAITEAYGGSGRFTWALKANTGSGPLDLYQLLEGILENTSSRLVPWTDTAASNRTALTLYPFGTKQNPTIRITDTDAKIIQILELSPESVVNSVVILYDRKLTYTRAINENGPIEDRNYAGTLTWSGTNNGDALEFIGESEFLYRKRFIGNQRFDYIGDATSAESSATEILTKYAFPTVYVTLELPLFRFGKAAWQTTDLEFMDVITITHPDLPSFFGSTSSASPPTYTTLEVEMGGEHIFRAQPYRAQIEGKELFWEEKTAPRVRLKCRLILNPEEPT